MHDPIWQAEKKKILARLSIAIYKMTDEQLIALLHLFKDLDLKDKEKLLEMPQFHQDGVVAARDRQLLIARFFLRFHLLFSGPGSTGAEAKRSCHKVGAWRHWGSIRGPDQLPTGNHEELDKPPSPSNQRSISCGLKNHRSCDPGEIVWKIKSMVLCKPFTDSRHTIEIRNGRIILRSC
jgi:hypothetical protein